MENSIRPVHNFSSSASGAMAKANETSKVQIYWPKLAGIEFDV